MADPVSRDDVLELFIARLATVLARDDITPDSRFDEDLQADSLDLVEVFERVESELAERGIVVSLAEEELLLVRTVGDAAERLHAHANRAAG